MKITGRESGVSVPNPDLLLKPNNKSRKQLTRRKSKGTGNGVRLRRDHVVNRGSRPETPLLKWKFNQEGEGIGVDQEVVKEELSPPDGRREIGRKVSNLVSVRKLGSAIWRMQLPEVPIAGGRLGFQSGDDHLGVNIHSQPNRKVRTSASNDWTQSPRSVSGPSNKFLFKVESSLQPSNLAMECATKWDPPGWKMSDKVKQVHGDQKLVEREERAASRIFTLEAELEQARTKIDELETEKRSSKKKLEHFLKKLGEEKAAWRSREHEKVRAIIDDIKFDLNRERKSRQRVEIVNSKIVDELAEAKSVAKRYMQELDKERKARELIEEVCDELAKEIGEDKAEVEALKRESMNLREEVDEERKMLQMAEVWREERVQMKLIDAKVALEEKYSYMNKLIADLESFLSSTCRTPSSEDMRKAELFQQAATSVNIQDMSEFTYQPPNSDDIFSVFEDVNFGGQIDKQIKQCVTYTPTSHSSKIHDVSPKISTFNKDIISRHSHPYMDRDGPLEEEGSEWETVSQADDQGSSYSPDGSDFSANRTERASNVSRSRTDWEGNVGDQETPITEISEVCSVPSRQLKKASSISRLWRSCQSNGENYKIISVDGINGRLSNGRLSNGTFISHDCDSGKGGLSPPDLAGEWSSPESGNPHITKGMKGCIEWPRSAQKGNLKSKLLEARMESQKVQLRHVLKQKI